MITFRIKTLQQKTVMFALIPTFLFLTAIGVDDGLRYVSSLADILPEKQLIVIGSDGAWEAGDPQGEMFGKKRLKQLITDHSEDASETIIEHINDEIDLFLDGRPPQDDITFVIIKIDGETFG